MQADSLRKALNEIQSVLGSPEVQRIDEISRQVRKDLELVPSEDSVAEPDQGIVNAYEMLGAGLDSCLSSCSRYHEEAYMIESSLEEISDLMKKNGADPREIKTRLAAESLLLEELSQRIEATLTYKEIRLRQYNNLKPQMDSIKAPDESGGADQGQGHE